MGNVEVGRTVFVKENMSDRVHSNVSKWFEHVEGTRSKQLTKKMYKSDVNSRRNRGRPCTW